MIAKRRPHYRGRLTPEDASKGAEAAITQAWQLANDARHLLFAGSYATSFALAALSIEELGKVQALREIAKAETEKELKRAWRNYSDHSAKSRLWMMAKFLLEGSSDSSKVRLNASNLSQNYNENLPDHNVLNIAKQIGFYSECVGDIPKWLTPNESIEKIDAEQFIQIAEFFLTFWGSVESPIQIEIFIRHFRSQNTQREGLTTQALVRAYCQDLIDAGFAPSHIPSWMEIT